MILLITRTYFWLTLVLVLRQQLKASKLRRQAEQIVVEVEEATSARQSLPREENDRILQRLKDARAFIAAAEAVPIGIYWIANCIGLLAIILLERF